MSEHGVERSIENADYTYFMYRNHNDIFEKRMVKIERLWYGQSVHYSEHPDSWFIRGICNDRNGHRDFMLSRIVGMYQWNWLLDGSHPIEHPLGTSAEQALHALFVEITGCEERNWKLDEVFKACMKEIRLWKELAVNENTMVFDIEGNMIHVGDVVRLAVDANSELHGEWSEHEIQKAPGGYRLSYLRSEKGEVLPVGYTGGLMYDFILEKENTDLKQVVFAQVPIKSTRLRIVTDGRSDFA